MLSVICTDRYTETNVLLKTSKSFPISFFPQLLHLRTSLFSFPQRILNWIHLNCSDWCLTSPQDVLNYKQRRLFLFGIWQTKWRIKNLMKSWLVSLPSIHLLLNSIHNRIQWSSFIFWWALVLPLNSFWLKQFSSSLLLSKLSSDWVPLQRILKSWRFSFTKPFNN